MADQPEPARSVTATSDDFRKLAKSAGDELKAKLQEDLDSATTFSGFVEFEWNPYKDVLKAVMDRFEKHVSCASPAHRKDVPHII